MARLTTADKQAFKTLSTKGWIQSEEERSPMFVNPTPEVNERYCRWVSGISKVFTSASPGKPAKFFGSNWKL